MSQLVDSFNKNKKKKKSTPSFISSDSRVDRRNVSNDRRRSSDRRKTPDRREANASSPNQDIHSRLKRQNRKEISMNLVRVLEEEYRKILSLMNQLILSVELESYSQLPDHIQKFDEKIKSNLSLEEDMLCLFVDSLRNKSFKEKNEIHTLLDKFIYDASQKIIEIMKPYLTKEVSGANAKSFLREIDKIDRILANNHKQKENYLYRIYTKCFV